MIHEGKPLVSGMTVTLSGKQTLGELGPLQSAESLSHGWWVEKGWAPVFTRREEEGRAKENQPPAWSPSKRTWGGYRR